MENLNKLRALARRVGKGDAVAVTEFRAELEPGLTRVIQRVLRGRCRNDALQARVRAEADRVSVQTSDGSSGDKAVAAQVARAICTSILEEIRAEPERCAVICDTIAG